MAFRLSWRSRLLYGRRPAAEPHEPSINRHQPSNFQWVFSSKASVNFAFCIPCLQRGICSRRLPKSASTPPKYACCPFILEFCLAATTNIARRPTHFGIHKARELIDWVRLMQPPKPDANRPIRIIHNPSSNPRYLSTFP